VPHVLADVLKTEPDWRRLPQNLHPRVQLLLERCLTKKPRDRLHSIADARVEIEAVLRAPEGVTPESVAAAVPKQGNNVRLVGVAAAAAVVAAALVWFLRPEPAPEAKPVVRFSIPLPADQALPPNAPVSTIAMSPDGTRIAYVANNQLFLRNLAEPEARPVPGTDEGPISAALPAFSPDGQWLAYVHVATATGPYIVKRVPIAGGAPVTIQEKTGTYSFPRGLTWPTIDSILYADDTGIVRIPANGGAAEVLVALGQDERFDSPQLLPGGKAVLFTRTPGTPSATGGYEAAQVVVQSIGKNDRAVVWEGGSAARYVPTGHLVYAQGTALFAIAFDPDARTVSGGPVPILDRLRRAAGGRTDAANLAVSATGNFAMIPGDPNANGDTRRIGTLSWVDRSGHEEPLPVRPDEYTLARISPDGTKIALLVGTKLVSTTQPAIWIFDTRTENLSLLVSDPDGDDGPVWSSDSRRLYFRAFRGRTAEVHSIEVDTGERKVVVASSDHPFPLPWTIAPDDSVLGLVDALTLENIDISMVSIADGKFTPLLHEPTAESEPSIAANGAWLAYSEGTAGGDPNAEINIRPFPGVARTRIPVGRGMTPVFSRDGSELYFVAGDSLMAAPVTYTPAFRVGAPQRVFESPAYQWAIVGRAWDMDPSGRRFLMIRKPGAPAGNAGPSTDRIDVVLNWFEELKARVPVK
jgi:dipeptidyl aminopeptidase/acylaminoacyl peptidase